MSFFREEVAKMGQTSVEISAVPAGAAFRGDRAVSRSKGRVVFLLTAMQTGIQPCCRFLPRTRSKGPIKSWKSAFFGQECVSAQKKTLYLQADIFIISNKNKSNKN